MNEESRQKDDPRITPSTFEARGGKGAAILPVEPFDYVVFGATGDLSLRKLMVALYHRERDRQFTEPSRIIGASRSKLSDDAFREKVRAGLEEHLAPGEFEEGCWQRFSQRLSYLPLDAKSEEGWPSLGEALADGVERVRIFYLATAPNLFGPICKRLQAESLVTPLTRVVLEKPIGHDLESSRRINEEVGRVFAEQQIFRIDHYLGKETVQNLLALRFANSLFEPLWNAANIDHVQITVAETVGVEGRGAYYDAAGALRDMIQNHLLQLLCLVAMEPPNFLDEDSVRDEKLKVLRSLKPLGEQDVSQWTVRGQYAAGAAKGQSVVGYLEEPGIEPNSKTETFVALKAEVENWRWTGVPFYLRSGKRLPEKVSEIVIQFKTVPHSIFPKTAGALKPNRLVVRLQPDEAIRLHLMAKDPGPGGLRLKEAPLNLSFAETFQTRFPDAYERLLMDVVRGNPTLFMRRDEVEAAWRWSETIVQAWAGSAEAPKSYIAGTWGPSAAIALIERDGRTWHE
ncbi:MAG: glucose-6-phosphate dehydrogenase [Limibacillus sp.]